MLDYFLRWRGNIYNDDGPNQDDWDGLQRDIVEERLEKHGRLYPLVSVEVFCRNLATKWNMRINCKTTQNRGLLKGSS